MKNSSRLWRLKKRRIGAEKAALLAFDDTPLVSMSQFQAKSLPSYLFLLSLYHFSLFSPNVLVLLKSFSCLPFKCPPSPEIL